LVRPLSTVDNTRDYARVSHSNSGLTITKFMSRSVTDTDTEFINTLAAG